MLVIALFLTNSANAQNVYDKRYLATDLIAVSEPPAQTINKKKRKQQSDKYTRPQQTKHKQETKTIQPLPAKGPFKVETSGKHHNHLSHLKKQKE